MSRTLLLLALVPWIASTPPDPRPKIDLPKPPRRETVLTPQVVASDAAEDVLDALRASRLARCIRVERSLAVGATVESEAVRDSAELSVNWLRRFHRACLRLPAGDCGESRLSEGESDTLVIRIEGIDARSQPTVELDLRQRCIRFLRKGGIVAMRSMGGKEAQFLALVREANPRDLVMRDLDLAVDGDGVRPPPSNDGPQKPYPAFGDYVYVEELPTPIDQVAPVAPPMARQAGVGGTVIVNALVGRDGHVHDTRITKSIPMLDQAAEDCVRRWVFKPAQSGGGPTAVWVAIPIRFNLE